MPSSRWRTSTPRRASSPPRSRGSSRRAANGSEIAVFYRTNAQSRVLEDVLVRQDVAVPGDRRPAVLRARRDQGRDRLPPGARQPGRRRVAPADREPAAARDRRHDARAARRARGGAWASRSSRRSTGPRRPAWRAAPLRNVQALWTLLQSLQAAARGADRARAGRARARGLRLPRRARLRAHDRGAGPHGEPARARRRRPGVPVVGGRAEPVELPPGDLALLRHRTRCARRSRSSR